MLWDLRGRAVLFCFPVAVKKKKHLARFYFILQVIVYYRVKPRQEPEVEIMQKICFLAFSEAHIQLAFLYSLGPPA